MRVHYLQHVPFEGLGSIEPWLNAADYLVTATRFYESALLPPPEDVDMLIILGGPMGVHNEEQYPWLRTEKQFIRQIVESGKPVLGICLGAHLIVDCLGESVYPNRRKEIGWFPIYGVDHQSESLFSFPDKVEVFHWHGETFDLPQGAELLASSKGCKNQAFQLGTSVIGLQFHLESGPETVQAMIKHCQQDILPSKFVQPESALLDTGPHKYRIINNLMDEILSFLTGHHPGEEHDPA